MDLQQALGRVTIAIALVLVGLAALWLTNRLNRRGAHGKLALLGGQIDRGAKLLVYFTAPYCAPCKTVQKPAIRDVQQQLGADVEVIEIDVSQQPSLADGWGVLSLPTTFVVSRKGKITSINRGVARSEKLLAQLSQA